MSAVVASSGTITVTDDDKAHGTLSVLIDKTSTSGANYITQTLTADSSVGADVYLKIVNAPVGGEVGLFGFFNGSVRQVGLAMTTTRVIALKNGANAAIWTSPPLDVGVWYRLSLFADRSTGDVRTAVYLSDSLTPISSGDSGLLGDQNVGVSDYAAIRWGGSTGTGSVTARFYMDDPGYDVAATGLIQPWSEPDEPLATPVVSATVENVSAPGVSDGTVLASWAAVTNADHYEVAVANAHGATSGFTVLDADVRTTSYLISGRSAGPGRVRVVAIP